MWDTMALMWSSCILGSHWFNALSDNRYEKAMPSPVWSIQPCDPTSLASFIKEILYRSGFYVPCSRIKYYPLNMRRFFSCCIIGSKWTIFILPHIFPGGFPGTGAIVCFSLVSEVSLQDTDKIERHLITKIYKARTGLLENISISWRHHGKKSTAGLMVSNLEAGVWMFK